MPKNNIKKNIKHNIDFSQSNWIFLPIFYLKKKDIKMMLKKRRVNFRKKKEAFMVLKEIFLRH